jgi:hypothetical protein
MTTNLTQNSKMMKHSFETSLNKGHSTHLLNVTTTSHVHVTCYFLHIDKTELALLSSLSDHLSYALLKATMRNGVEL